VKLALNKVGGGKVSGKPDQVECEALAVVDQLGTDHVMPARPGNDVQ